MDFDETWTYCFSSGDLNSFTVENDGRGKPWTGDITMTHSDERYAALMFCQNCDCDWENCEPEVSFLSFFLNNSYCAQIFSDGETYVISYDCDEICVAEHAINFGFGELFGDTQCSLIDVCPFAVTWNIRGTIINIYLRKLYVY